MSVVFYSVSPFGTGDIKTGSPTLTISGGLATLSVAQTGNIGAGCRVTYDTSKVAYIAPAKLAFTSGGTFQVKLGHRIVGAISGAEAIIRAVELTSGTWAGGDAAGNFYLESQTGTFQSENIDVDGNSNVATISSDSVGNMSTTFVLKTATGGTPGNEASAVTVNSIAHEYASGSAWEAGFTDANHINNTDLTSAQVIAHGVGYYDHDDDTIDSIVLTIDGTTTSTVYYIHFFCARGNKEAINNNQHNGTRGNGYRIHTSASWGGAVINNNDDNVFIDGISVKNTSADESVGVLTIGDTTIKNCLVSDSTSFGIKNMLDGKTLTIINCFVYNTGCGINGHYGITNIYNSTVLNTFTGTYGNGCGIRADAFRTTNAYNCYSGNSSVADYYKETNGNLNLTTCASSDGSESTTVVACSTSSGAYFTNVTAGSEDAHIGSSSGLKDIGTDYSNLFEFDFEGSLRSGSWDIGADEYIAAGGIAIPVIMQHLRQQGIN